MMDLIATGRLPYGTRVLKAGDPLRVTSQDGIVLVALGKAKKAPPRAAPPVDAPADPPAVVETKDMAAENDKDDDGPRAKRKYGRKDMAAE